MTGKQRAMMYRNICNIWGQYIGFVLIPTQTSMLSPDITPDITKKLSQIYHRIARKRAKSPTITGDCHTPEKANIYDPAAAPTY